MVVPVGEYRLKYRDVYTVDLPFSPPPEFLRGLNTDQEREVAKLRMAPRAMHVVRLENGGGCPITTAPALVLLGDRVLAQGMTTYTPRGGRCDLTLTQAVDMGVKKLDTETKRTPNAATFNDASWTRIELDGKVTLTNSSGRAAEVEVTRAVLGAATSADHDGVIEQSSVLEDSSWISASSLPSWWWWLPQHWSRANGIARIRWSGQVDPGKSLELRYGWSYLWR
jgi:hypothetical protein